MAADANHGAELAKRWCATCHLVDSESGNTFDHYDRGMKTTLAVAR